jgi:deazaflavin-dependent oxidoreductase (nitroreductase family)
MGSLARGSHSRLSVLWYSPSIQPITGKRCPLVPPIGHTHGVRDATARRLSRLHAILYRTTRGRVGTRLAANDMLLLTTRGRTSGKLHTVPLLYLQDGETPVVVASWGGRDYHPDWYLNLIAQPAATVNIGEASRHVIARTADQGERAIWWPRVQQAYRSYQVYQSRTRREIPIVFLEPRASS